MTTPKATPQVALAPSPQIPSHFLHLHQSLQFGGGNLKKLKPKITSINARHGDVYEMMKLQVDKRMSHTYQDTILQAD